MPIWRALVCALALVLSTTASAHPSPYVVDGLALGGQVKFNSEAYSQYQCMPSEYPGLTWCHKETRHGDVLLANSILHSQDGTAVYVNHYVEPAVFGPRDVRNEIDRLSAKFGQAPREFRMPPREGLPDAIIAVWGNIELVQLDASDVSIVASGASLRKGILLSFLGDVQHSAKMGVPVYRLAGGPGYVWAATFNRTGRGVLRFLAIDPSEIARPPVAINQPPPSPPAIPSPPAAPSSPPVSGPPGYAEGGDYARIGWWSISYKDLGNLTGCSAGTRFGDGTTLELALVQSDTAKAWVVLLSNPNWNRWLPNRSQYTLWLVTTKPWQGNFHVSDDKKTLISDEASIDFMNSIADAHSLMIFNSNRQLLTESPLSMTDSDPAIKAVVHCVRDHPPNPAPIPEVRDNPSTPAAPSKAETVESGTAFFVAPNFLLTNNHVINECTGAIHVRYPERAPHEAKIFGLDGTNDLALLRTEMDGPAFAAFHVRPRLGESVAAYGFPYPDTLSSSGNFTLGNVTSLSGMADDTRFLQVSTPVQPGNSGGPLLDMSGSVVGVIVGQLNALQMMKTGHGVPQNVNFAIQVPLVINFLSIKGVTPKLETSNVARTLSPSDVADMAKQFTVQISCPAASPTAGTTGPVTESGAVSHR